MWQVSAVTVMYTVCVQYTGDNTFVNNGLFFIENHMTYLESVRCFQSYRNRELLSDFVSDTQ